MFKEKRSCRDPVLAIWVSDTWFSSFTSHLLSDWKSVIYLHVVSNDFIHSAWKGCLEVELVREY